MNYEISKDGVKKRMRAIVIFYSLTNKTRLVSQVVADGLNAKLLEIKERKQRTLNGSTYFWGGFAAITNKASNINPTEVDLSQYDTVFIGSPVWASRPTPAINSFIYKTNFRNQGIVPFFTMAGDNADKALANIKTKISRSHGEVIGSFAIQSYGKTNDEILAKAKEAIKSYAK